MPRKKYSKIKRIVEPDPRYGSEVLARFVGRMMLDGKRVTCQNIVHRALDLVASKTQKEPLEVFLKALDNVKPMVEVKSRRVGGATFQIPIEIRDSRKEALAMRWIIASARKRSGRDMAERLGNEFVDAFSGAGAAFKKREDMHKMAEANRAFAHFR
ncbi:MAG: 30S ribosomal protein S7 [Spirochaetia bacterium]